MYARRMGVSVEKGMGTVSVKREKKNTNIACETD